MGLPGWRWVVGSVGASLLLVWGAFQAHDALHGDLSLFAAAEAQETVARAPLPNPSEIERLRIGVAASDRGDWNGLRSARGAGRDPLVNKLLQWRLACETNSNATFEEVRDALAQLTDWPCRDTMRRRGEQLIFDSGLSPAERISWLRAGGPVSGDGKVALALALSSSGQRAEAAPVVRDAWRRNALTRRAEDEALVRFSDVLTAGDHAERADRCLWRDDRSCASRMLGYMATPDRLLTNARIVLQTRPKRGVQQALDAVPASLQNHAGLLYDRTRYIRRTGRPERAIEVAGEINPLTAPEDVRETLAKERRLYVPRAIRGRNYRLAYDLAATHGLKSGAEFADSEWLAGWIALRFLRDQTRADQHFTTLDAGVSSPVSKSRSLYWRAQSRKALGAEAEALTLLGEAAKLDYTYYGQLAATKLGTTPVISLGEPAAIPQSARIAFENRELVRAMKLMAEVGDRKDVEAIAFYIDGALDTPDEHEMLAQLARERGYMRTAVRTAKAGLFRGIVAPQSAYPVITLPPATQRPGAPEPALVHAIIRQETEFDPGAVSSAGARGLMQLMPATARAVAKREGLGYTVSSLTADPNYNIALGSAYLQQMLEQWNGSYVLTIASYNAGPNRAAEWIGDYGDPRSPGVDVVDWVELIPISETRNYVQRVLENVQVYRHRLARTPTPITLERDLRRGAYS